MYKVELNIPNMVSLNQGEVKSWFYQSKNEILQYDDDLFKLNCVKQFYLNRLEQLKNAPQIHGKLTESLCYIQT